MWVCVPLGPIPRALHPPPGSGLEENAFFSHPRAVQTSSQLCSPSSQTAGSQAGADKGAGAAEPLMQLISERGTEVIYFPAAPHHPKEAAPYSQTSSLRGAEHKADKNRS